MPEATVTDAGSAPDEIEAEIGFAFARYLSAKDMDASPYGLVRAAVEPIVEDLIAARKERDEAIIREETLRGASSDAEYWAQEAAQLRSRLLEAERGAEAMRGDPGRAAYEARFADARPRDVEPWDTLTPEVKAIWARVEMACRAAVSASAREG